MRYQILLFDADNTLLDFTRAELNAFETTMKEHGYPYDEDAKKRYDSINHSLWKRYEKGEISRDEVLYTRFGTYFEQIGVEGDGVAFEKEYQDRLSQGSYVIDGAMEVLKNLKQMENCECYILTNGVAHTQHRRLNESGILAYMDGVFISEELGCQKPAVEFYDRVFETIGEEKRKKSLMIGDTLSSDILGGNYSNLATCWYNPGKRENDVGAKVDYEISDLAELYPIVS